MTRNSPLQRALFQAAKVGNIKLMREFIQAGADPFDFDEELNNAFYYAKLLHPEETIKLLKEIVMEEEEKA